MLPSGRIVTPAGRSAVTGMNALGFALSPDGRYAIVSNDDERSGDVRSAVDPSVLGGYSLAVIDTLSLRVVDRFTLPGETYFAGVVAIADPMLPDRTLVFAAGGPSDTVAVLDLDSGGHLMPDRQHVITIAGPLDDPFAAAARSFPATLVAASDGRRVYAVSHAGDSVAAIDTASRSVAGPSRSVGFFPFGAALAGDRLLVSNEGLMRYAHVPDASLAPPFAAPGAQSTTRVVLVAGGTWTRRKFGAAG